MYLLLALDVRVLSWSDIVWCTNHKHTQHRDYRHEDNDLERGRRCRVDAVLPLRLKLLMHSVRTSSLRGRAAAVQ